jgi:hypothetical protein
LVFFAAFFTFGFSFSGLWGVLIALLSAASKRSFASFSLNSSATLEGVFMSDDSNNYVGGEIVYHPLPETDPHLGAVGKVATTWALFEYTIDGALWTLAELKEDWGACITTQMMSISPRLKAYLALVRVRGVPEGDLINRINKFIGDSEPLAQKRNRAVHDPWVIGESSKAVYQLKATANRKLEFGFRPRSLPDLQQISKEIEAHTERFSSLHVEVRAWLWSLQNKGPAAK